MIYTETEIKEEKKKIKGSIKRLEEKKAEAEINLKRIEAELFAIVSLKNSENVGERLKYREKELDYGSLKLDIANINYLITKKKYELQDLDKLSEFGSEERQPE